MWPFGGGGNTADATIKINYKGDDAIKGLQSLKGTIGTVISALAIKQIVGFTWELGKLGAQATLVEKNFAGFADRAGRTTEDMMGKLRKATMNTVKDIELQQFAMKAMISGINFDDAITMMEYVTKYAMSTGDSVSERMRTVVTGLARGSALMLDDVGIMVTKTGDVVVKATDQMKEKMNLFTTSEQDAAVAAAAMSAEWENQKAIMGKAILPLYTDISNLLANKLIPAMGTWVSESVKMLKVLFTSKTLEDERVDRLIELAKAAGDEGVLQDHLNKKLTEQITIRKNIKAIEEQPGRKTGLDKDQLEIQREKLAKVTEQIVKLGLAQKEIKEPKNPPKEKSPEKKKRELSDEEKDRIKKAAADKKSFEEKMASEEKEIRNKAEEDKFNAFVEWNEKYNNFLEMQNQERITIEEEGQKAILGEDEYYHKQKIDLLKYQRDVYPELAREINALIEEENDNHNKKELEKAKRHNDAIIADKIRVAETMISTADTISNALMTISNLQAKKELTKLEELHDKRLISQKEYDKRREKIEKEATEKRRAWARVQQGIAIAEAIVNVYKAATQVYSTEWGGVFIKSMAMAAAIAEGMMAVAVIQEQNFATGRIGESKRGRQADNIIAAVGEGETIIPAQQSTVHEETLRAISNNTANTAAGMKKIGSGGGGVTNNFYGASTEQILNVIAMSERKNRVGQKI